jgi:hypothetical protein
MPPTTTRRTRSQLKAPIPSIALAALVASALGLAACGGSSSTTPKTSANAAALSTTTAAATAPGNTGSTATTPGAAHTTTTTGGSTTTPAPSNTDVPSITAIRACLSKKGITLPQSHPLADAKLPKGMSQSQFYEELRGCAGGLLPKSHIHSFPHTLGGHGFHNPYDNPRFHAVLVRFSACLRQQGINVGEPNTSGKGPLFDTKGINTGSPQFKTATAKCRSTLIGAFRGTAHPGTSTK